MNEPSSPEDFARASIAGDRSALDALVRALQSDVYAVAIRTLWNRDDAEDATQEILIRVVTRLATFDSRSRLKTWVYRIAVNYLMDAKKSAVERMNMTFVRISEDLQSGLSDNGPSAHEHSILVEEVKFGCTLAMLQCLDRPHRLAYILGEILDLSGPDAAEALGIGPEVLRKRLERARSAIQEFTAAYCGLVSDDSNCRCNRRVPVALALGRVDAAAPQFAEHGVSFESVKEAVRTVGVARAALEVHRTTYPRESSIDMARRIVARFE